MGLCPYRLSLDPPLPPPAENNSPHDSAAFFHAMAKADPNLTSYFKSSKYVPYVISLNPSKIGLGFRTFYLQQHVTIRILSRHQAIDNCV